MSANEDWYAWHLPYDDPDSPLAARLRVVQRHIAAWLDSRPSGPLRVVSACAGQGRDLLGVLADRPDAARVSARLVEADPRNVADARARAAGLTGVEVLAGDAGLLASYAGAVPADLVLIAGVLGNVTEADARTIVEALPGLCAAGATVIWTRSRRPPDLTPLVRAWLAEAGFVEQAFEAPSDAVFAVGVHVFTGRPRPLGEGRIFRFVP